MSFQRHSEFLRYKLELMNGPHARAAEAFWNHPRLKQLIPWAIARIYMITNATVPLMEAALDRARAIAQTDPVAAGFADYLVEHIPEEAGHDEQFLEDLEAFGMSKAQVRTQMPWPSLAALIGMQYYWILRRHPIAFVGYSAILEGNPTPLESIEEILVQTGLPRDGFRTLIWHSRHDPAHSTELDRMLDALPLSSEQMSLIGINIAHTHQLLARSVHEMIAAFEEQAALAVQ